MKYRIEHECLASGQPRPYADSINRVRVTFLWQGIPGYKNPDAPFVPDPSYSDAHKGRVETALKGMMVGYTDTPPEGWWSTRLEYLKMTAPSVWEFQTRDPYTD